uniref:Uncharacterized protein n=1 Tax=Anguilla anguilla TaxID=7936 RepID=A0A0E9TMX5_ANGAN
MAERKWKRSEVGEVKMKRGKRNTMTPRQKQRPILKSLKI